MTGHRISLKGFKLKDGKLQRISGYGLSASMKLQQKKSKRTRPVKRKP